MVQRRAFLGLVEKKSKIWNLNFSVTAMFFRNIQIFQRRFLAEDLRPYSFRIKHFSLRTFVRLGPGLERKVIYHENRGPHVKMLRTKVARTVPARISRNSKFLSNLLNIIFSTTSIIFRYERNFQSRILANVRRFYKFRWGHLSTRTFVRPLRESDYTNSCTCVLTIRVPYRIRIHTFPLL